MDECAIAEAKHTSFKEEKLFLVTFGIFKPLALLPKIKGLLHFMASPSIMFLLFKLLPPA